MNKKDDNLKLASLEELLLQDFERLTELIEIYNNQINDNRDNNKESEESVANAIVRLINQREKVLEKYYSISPDQESPLIQFKNKPQKLKQQNIDKESEQDD